MPKKPKSPQGPSELRTLAEQRVDSLPTDRPASSDYDPHRLLHELEVHQIELEMQNAELRSARDQAERVLEKYTDLYDFAPVGYFTLAADGTILLANLTGASLVGIERGRLVGRSFASLVPADRCDAFQDFLRTVVDGEARQAIDSELRRVGRPPLSVNIEVQRSPDGNDFRVAMMDTTARKLAEESKLRNETLFTALIERVPVGVYVVDHKLRMQQANPVAMKLLAKIRPLIGRDISEVARILWPKRVADQAAARFRHTLKTGESYQSPEFAHRRRDIGLDEVYEWQLQRVTLPAGEFGVVCFFNNITERRKAEAVRRQMEVLTASNLRLGREIVKRQIVEDSLRQTKQEQARLLEQARLHQKQLRDVSYQVLRVQEEERKRISRELHDVIAQTLVGINVHLASLNRDSTTLPKAFKQKIRRTQQLVEESVEVVHQFALELRPTTLDDLGLIPALHELLKKFMAENGIHSSLKVFAGIEQSPSPVRTMLYRVVQEALANVAQHSKASEVAVKIESAGAIIRMKVTDNGKGFEVNTVTPHRLGLLGMKERVEMVGGTFLVESVPGLSTTVSVEFKNVPKKSLKTKPTPVP